MKKIICLVLCAVMVFSLGVTAFAAQDSSETVTGEYSYCPSLGFLDFVSNQTSTFTYSDSYFTHSGYEGSPKTSAKCPFVDVKNPYLKSVTWAAKEGITLGKDATHFEPNSPCTRAQVVTFLYRDMA